MFRMSVRSTLIIYGSDLSDHFLYYKLVEGRNTSLSLPSTFKKKYLFIYLAAPGLSYGTRDLHCRLRDL